MTSSVGGAVNQPLSAAQIIGYAQAAGFSVVQAGVADLPAQFSSVGSAAPSPAEVATAIALAESSGNPVATHKNSNGTTDYGLWQINSVHADLLSKYEWSDPSQNATMAFQVYQAAGGKFTPWSTFTGGQWLLHLNAAETASTQTSGQAPIDTIVGGNLPGASALEQLSTFLTDLTKPGTWASVGFILLGIVLLITALVKLVVGSKAGKAVVGAASKAVAL